MPVKNSTPSFQGRRFVKFKEPTEHSENYSASAQKEQRADPHKITWVTEIMVDISDSESKENDNNSSEIKSGKSSENQLKAAKSVFWYPSSSTDNKNLLSPDKFEFMNKVRKRSQKEREKDKEGYEENKLTEDMVVKMHSGDGIKIPYINEALRKKNLKSIESILLK